MIILQSADYEKYKYTKVNVQITLNECPSDYLNSRYFLDVNCEKLCQKEC